MTKVLVTGCAGFIGSHVAQACLDQGWEVDGIDNLSNGHEEFVPAGVKVFVRQDFASPAVLRDIPAGKYDYVFHLAANARVSYSVEYPMQSHDNNVTKTLALINACNGHIKRFIFSSSSAVYGDISRRSAKESDPEDPQSPYALQKLIIEDYLRLYAKLYNFDSICLRYFNVYGPHQVGGSPYATALGNWLAAIVNDDYCRFDGDGTQRRDLVYVADVAKANILAACMEKQRTLSHSIFNVGTGCNISNGEIMQMLGQYFKKIKICYAEPRVGDVRETKADIAAIMSALNFKYEYDFCVGFDKTVKWAVETPYMKTLRSVTG